MAAVTDGEYIRVCPTCGEESAPNVMRCVCGALLAGIDLIRPQARAAPAVSAPAPAAPATLVCPYEDCGQANPPGNETCGYCNRRLAAGAALTVSSDAGLLNLPANLKSRYRVREVFPATGAEAELSLVEPLSGGPVHVAKLYRKGVLPKTEVRERVARIDERYRVRILEEGISDGFAYEVMEYCTGGSLRDWLESSARDAAGSRALVQTLAAAVEAVHAAGVVHRDLKPENILIRSREPLQLVLTDFGVSSVLDATQRFTGSARTLAYASPESLSGVIDDKADYWALGMILLEATLGRHPFAGLSDPVVMHHLTTRSIDLAAVHDADIRKLLRGLLLRDPGRRWGAAEVKRWLAGDASLPEVVEHGDVSSFAQAYRVGGEACDTPLQLATVLTRHWSKGVEDIANGQLLAWFRDVQKDQDVVRLLLGMRNEAKVHVDVQLLRLILQLAPGIPPVWRGESVELRAILHKASLALKGDVDAARWLNSVHQHRVLQAYAAAGNVEAADLVSRWGDSIQRLDDAWKARVELLRQREVARPDRVVHYDDVAFGRLGPERPSLLVLHPRLLAVAYDPAWAERLRKRLVAELTPAVVHCPWLADLGDPLTMGPADLLVLEALLPEAKKAVENQQKTASYLRAAEQSELQVLQGDFREIVALLRERACGASLAPSVCEDIESDIARFDKLIGRLRSAGETRTELRELRNQAARIEPIVNRLHDAVAALSQRRAVNRGWLSWRVGGFLFASALFLPTIPGTWPGYVVIAFAVALIVWRLLPNRWLMQRIRQLGSGLGGG